MRIVLVPVGVTGLRFGRLISDRLEIDAVRQQVELRLVADLGQLSREVFDRPLGRLLIRAVDVDGLARRPGLLNELLRLREVEREVGDLLVLRVTRRQEVLRRPPETAERARDDRLAVDGVVDRLTRLDVVERWDLVVEEVVTSVSVRVDPEL